MMRGSVLNVKVLRLWWILLAGSMMAAPAIGADIKIGYVNAARLLEESPQAAEVSKRLKQEFSQRETALVTDQKELKRLEDQLIRDGAVMSETERSKLERDVSSLKRNVRRDAGEFREDLNLRRNEEIGKLLEIVQAAIEVIGKEQNYDLIVYEGIAYASPAIDLTETVLEKLRAPAGAPAKN